jgi:hypothetical protein
VDQRRTPYPFDEAQAELERRVADRTVELAETNRRLRHEKGTRIVVELPLAASSPTPVARRQSVSH